MDQLIAEAFQLIFTLPTVERVLIVTVSFLALIISLLTIYKRWGTSIL